MIKILKQTPITFKGRDRIELMVQDSDGCNDPCDHCCYDDYVLDASLLATCLDVHNCGALQDCYFIIA